MMQAVRISRKHCKWPGHTMKLFSKNWNKCHWKCKIETEFMMLSLSHVQRLIWIVLESPMLPCWTLEILCLRAAIPPISGRVLILQQTQYYPLRCWIKAVNLLLVSQRWITWVEDPWLYCILTRILCFTPLISQRIPQIHTSNRIEQESCFDTPSKSCLKESSSKPSEEEMVWICSYLYKLLKI